MTSWERRRIRRIRVTVGVIVLFIVLIGLFFASRLYLPYETLDPSDLFTVTFTGYHGKGELSCTLDPEKSGAFLTKVKQDYREALLHLQHPSDADYMAFEKSLAADVSKTEGLSNGEAVNITYRFDETLAKKLNIKAETLTKSVTVEGLPEVSVYTKEDLFSGLSVSFTGISPALTMTVENTATDPFLKTVSFVPVDPKETYENGDVIQVRACFDAEAALAQNCVVEEDPGTLITEVSASSDAAYLNDAILLPASLVESLALDGLEAFTDHANEYGVRIFCEAHLVPVYVNKQPSFTFEHPTFRSAYFKVARPDYRGKNGTHYNDLDLVYEVTLKQSNGVTCPCYGVVRVSDLVLHADGSITNADPPQLVSADYSIDSIHKTVVTMFEPTHSVTNVSKH